MFLKSGLYLNIFKIGSYCLPKQHYELKMMETGSILVRLNVEVQTHVPCFADVCIHLLPIVYSLRFSVLCSESLLVYEINHMTVSMCALSRNENLAHVSTQQRLALRGG